VLTATAAGRHVAFEPFPSGVQAQERVPGRAAPITHSFLKAGGEKDYQLLGQVLEIMPSLADMRRHATSDQELRVCAARWMG
jgi:hypothetical protein